jgi:hypothetical protein
MPGMIGSIDCMQWFWDIFPVGWHGQCIGRDGKPSAVLEAVASHDLFIWHALFGTTGSKKK